MHDRIAKPLWAAFLGILIGPCFANDEVLDAAEAVREMIQAMDIPQAEKDQFLAQIQGVEKIQGTAIRLDIDAALQEYEIAIIQFDEAYLASLRAGKEANVLMAEALQALDDRQLAYAEVLKNRALATVAAAPSQETVERIGRRKLELAEACARLLAEAEADGVGVCEYRARYIEILARSADVEQTTSYVRQ